jgi:hypothetical protein
VFLIDKDKKIPENADTLWRNDFVLHRQTTLLALSSVRDEIPISATIWSHIDTQSF